MRKQIENIEAELDADKVTAEKKALLEKGNIMEENYREKLRIIQQIQRFYLT